LLRLPAELRNEIYKLVSKEFVWIAFCSCETPLRSNRTRVPLLLTCRQIRDEAQNMNVESHVLRLGTKVHAYSFGWAVADNRSRRHAMNDSIDTLQIYSGSLMLLSWSPGSLLWRLMDSAPSTHGWLRVLFPNLKRVELYGYREFSVDDFDFCEFKYECLGSAADASVELVLPSPPAPKPVGGVP
jgi:hypothetical protein